MNIKIILRKLLNYFFDFFIFCIILSLFHIAMIILKLIWFEIILDAWSLYHINRMHECRKLQTNIFFVWKYGIKLFYKVQLYISIYKISNLSHFCNNPSEIICSFLFFEDLTITLIDYNNVRSYNCILFNTNRTTDYY